MKKKIIKMTFKIELVKNVQGQFGLNIYETKVWLALLSRGVASAGEIAEISGVPRSRTYDVLEGLEKQGFAIMKIGKPVKYIAVKPAIVIEKLKSRAMSDVNDKIKTLSKLRNTEEYSELEKLHDVGIKPVRHDELSAMIKGKANITTHINNLINTAKSEVIIFTSANEVNDKTKFFSNIFEKLRKSKVELKIALSGSSEDIKKINERFKIKSRKVDFAGNFFITDKQEIMFMLHKNTNEEIATWLKSPFLSSAMAQLFDLNVNKEL